MKINKCCICGKDFLEFGNNPNEVKAQIVLEINEKQNQVNRKASNNYNQKRG